MDHKVTVEFIKLPSSKNRNDYDWAVISIDGREFKRVFLEPNDTRLLEALGISIVDMTQTK